MGDYSITFAHSASKELKAFDESLISTILHKIEGLTKEPHPKGCIKIKGINHFWRIRIGDYRVIYSIDDQNKIVDVIAIRHRSKAYR
ncbi:MAG: type II toxin-antitoxin system RelE/ParE family toxin [Candidatus Magnetoovum sp. WYHC-5]|nr:type II toxin-antitoxin system RelE/ParE family toxin [Candidatus Magnetoovum sp. WYHC-5]